VGCGPTDSQFKDVKSAVFSGNETLNTNIELSLGAAPIWLAGTIAGFVDEPEAKEASEYIDHISKVDLGVYELQDSLKGRFKEISKRVRLSMAEHGFEPIVLVHENNECVGVYAPLEGDKLTRELFVVVMQKKEVVLVRVEGNFEKLTKAVFRNHGHELPNFQKDSTVEMVL
jgi:hypothetical protein